MRAKALLVFSLMLVLCFCLSACSQTIVSTEVPLTEISPTLVPVVVPTIAPLPTANTSSVATAAPGPQLYVVQVGDTVWDISQEFGIPMAFIALQNSLVNIDDISPDQILIIPESADTPPSIEKTGKIIIVVISLQKVYAYENGEMVREFLVSTGTDEHPTVLGRFAIYVKYEKTTMSGPGYNLPDVPWTMYFYEGYGIHGTYWHQNFGHPMSHGCVNMITEEAEWLYSWAPVGTPVEILP